MVQSGSGCQGRFCSDRSKGCPPGAHRCAGQTSAADRGPLSPEPHWTILLRFILLIKFFPNWIILGFLPWWTFVSDLVFPRGVGKRERLFLILKTFHSDSR